MLPKERVLAAVSHEKPDRTPRDFWAELPALNRLYDYLGHSDEDRLLKDLSIDIRHVNAVTPPEKEVGEGVFQNFWGERYIYRPTPWGCMEEDTEGALSEAKSEDELEAFGWPTPDDFDYSKLRQECRRHQDYSLIYGFADVWQRPALVRGWEKMFLDMVDRPEWVHWLCRKFTDFYIEDYTRAQETCKGKIDLFLLISDLGTQQGPLISPSMFQEFVSPYLAEMIDHIHALNSKVVYHSCGAIHSLIPKLIELGVDVLDPIQPTGHEMEPERLKQDFSDQLCFHGGIDMQRLLPRGTPQEISKEVRRYEEVFSDSGGYVLGPAHFFQPDVPPENILAVYEEGLGSGV